MQWLLGLESNTLPLFWSSCLERMYPVTLLMKMCQVVIRQFEGYTQHTPEVVDYCEPFRDFWHQILKVYAPKRKS